MTVPRPLIAGNWKMNGAMAALDEARAVAAGVVSGGARVAICPPATLIGPMSQTPTPGCVEAMHAAIRAILLARFGDEGASPQILYGGSVKPGNAAEILHAAEVGGALVGGASLKAVDFLGIINAL